MIERLISRLKGSFGDPRVLGAVGRLQIRWDRDLVAVLNAHPENHRIWDGFVTHGPSGFYAEKIYTKTRPLQRSVTPAFVSLVDADSQRLEAALPAYTTGENLTVGFPFVPGTVFHAESLTPEQFLPPLLQQLVANARWLGITSISFQDMEPRFAGPLRTILAPLRFVEDPGPTYYFVPVDKYPSAADYLGAVFSKPYGEGFTRRDVRLLLRANLVFPELADFVRSQPKIQGFPAPEAADLEGALRQAALLASRKRQVDRGQDVLDLTYGVAPVDRKTTARIFPLFEEQCHRCGTPVRDRSGYEAYFREFGSLGDEAFYQVIGRGSLENPISFGLAFVGNGFWNSVYVGFQHVHSEAHSLYVAQSIWSFIEAKRRGLKTIDLGSSSDQAKQWLGAEPMPTTSFYATLH